MAVYASNLTKEQRRLLESYEAITGFEPTHQEALDSGEISFLEMWGLNEDFIFSIYATVQNLYQGE